MKNKRTKKRGERRIVQKWLAALENCDAKNLENLIRQTNGNYINTFFPCPPFGHQHHSLTILCDNHHLANKQQHEVVECAKLLLEAKADVNPKHVSLFLFRFVVDGFRGLAVGGGVYQPIH